jgi:hypothetical protein
VLVLVGWRGGTEWVGGSRRVVEVRLVESEKRAAEILLVAIGRAFSGEWLVLSFIDDLDVLVLLGKKVGANEEGFRVGD